LTLATIAGKGLQAAQFVPPVSISLERKTTILTPRQRRITAVATVRSDDAIQKLGGIRLLLTLPALPQKELPGKFLPQEYSKVIGEDEHIAVSVDARQLGGKPSFLTAAVSKDSHTYAEGYRAVGYGDLPRTNFYTPATLRVVPVDVTPAPSLKVAYLPGTGDDVPSALADLGVVPQMITVADLTPEKLKQYDAVVLGVRAYEAHRELLAANDVLSAY